MAIPIEPKIVVIWVILNCCFLSSCMDIFPTAGFGNVQGAYIYTPTSEVGSGNPINWSDSNIPLQILDYHPSHQSIFPSWSPAGNNILLHCSMQTPGITVLSSPSFTPLILTDNAYCWTAQWSPDGLSIAFLDKDQYLSLINFDGSNYHQLSDKSLRLPVRIIWTDNSHIIYSQYSGGGHSDYTEINTANGEEYELATIPGGDIGPYHNGYLPITTEIDISEFRLLVLSKMFPENKTSISAYITGGRYKTFPPYQSSSFDQSWTAFKDWVTETNQMLLEWKHYVLPSGNILKEELLLWDVQTNRIDVVGPNAIDGRLSADGRYLAYESFGPAVLDSNNTPLDIDKMVSSGLFNPYPDIQIYTQLLDIDSRQILFSIPSENTNFSPGGRFVAFLTKGKLSQNTAGIPENVQSTSEEYLHLFDLNSKKIMLSLSGVAMLPVWSNNGNSFLILDQFGMIKTNNLSTGIETEIARANEKWIIDMVSWSFDDQFIFILLKNPDLKQEPEKLIILQTP